MQNQPVVGRVVLSERPEIKSIIQPLDEALGVKDLAVNLVAELLLGVIKVSIPDFPGQIKLNPSPYTILVMMEYPRRPEEVKFGGKTVELAVGILVPSEKQFLGNYRLADKHYQKFNEAILCLHDFFQKIGWKIERVRPHARPRQ